jgi:flagellar hook-length control protein FliK
MTSFHLAANLPSTPGANGAAASLFEGQKEAGQGIFDTVLKNCMDKAGNQTSGKVPLNLSKSILMGENGGSASALQHPSRSIRGFLERIEPLIPVMGMLQIPPQAVPSLRAMLESLGITSKEASGLIQAASDSQGFVRLDRLWVRLKEKAGSADSGQETPAIPLHQVPVVAEMLSAMGMESAQVKALIEKATNGDGLDPQVLLRAAKAHLAASGTAAPGENKETSFSRAIGLISTTTETGLLAREPQLNALMKTMAEDPSLAQQERIKQEIGALLTEKGVSPQEVKAFLENLSVSQARDLLKLAQGFQGSVQSGDVSTLLSQLKVAPEKQSVASGDPQKIMDILSKDKAGQTSPADRKAASTALSSGSRPPGGTISAEAEGTATKKADPNSHSAGSASVLEGPSPSNGDTLTAGGKSVMVGGAAELVSAPGSKSAPQPPADSTLRTPVVLPEPLPRILDRMVWMVQGGVQKTTVELSPPELGRIQLNLVIENGQIRGVMGTESPMVKELIDANLNQLKTQLEALGFSVQSFEVTVGLNQHERADHGPAWQYEPKSAGASPLKKEEGVGPEAVGESYDGYSGDGHKINVRV